MNAHTTLTVTVPAAEIRLYSRQEAKAKLKIGDSKYWELIRTGKLEVVRLGRRTTRVKAASLEDLIERGVQL